jgi:hypothetical protein
MTTGCFHSTIFLFDHENLCFISLCILEAMLFVGMELETLVELCSGFKSNGTY